MQREKDDILKLRLEQELPDALEVHFDIREGKVSLTGVVDSLEDKDQAGQMVSQIPGVVSVENHLTVAGDKRFTDSKLGELIQERLIESGDRDLTGLSFQVHHGVVVLQGEVSHLDARESAGTLVSQIPGVGEIQNQIRIRTEEDSASIMNDLSLSLSREGVNLSEVEIRSQGNQVILGGWAQTRQDAERIMKTVRHVNGIKNIKNQMMIREELH
ncbi:BON domain-containing protein [Candidatus Formimonas warabiya]|nr:BON domain-containing protein [Candidatus Formimonas warabiya]